ncbi:gluconate 2-dehydrogenase subunit 3 family protein [Lutibacter sp.]|uniref:gluconate 2-dehydrogenase subunit 3 family protein n=1 Tax=Lutibacter sp. TaxID=1925666 RepID=UPI002735BB5F|nr:gluconate 2-dehydrogenase subunit 3 family protein [Lutibacter sp.]MDP3312841.1 gluconate 2-dehydrogenase subunit 3 family protein [Lutibacter sp.]
MKRRTALKNLSLSFGYVVATPTIINILSSCTESVETWKPLFLSSEEKHLVTHLVDIILPASEIPGALDVNVPQFIDKMYKEVEFESNQKIFQKGATIFIQKFEDNFEKRVEKGFRQEIEQLFETYFKLPIFETEKIIQEQRLTESEVSNSRKEDYLMYKFLFSVRNYTLFGYYTSEKIGKEVLTYDPIPGAYKGCLPIETLGNV